MGWPEVDLAHPLDGEQRRGRCVRSLEQTAAGLGADGPRLAAGCSARPPRGFDALSEDIMLPLAARAAPPAAPRRLRPAAPPGRPPLLARTLGSPRARALFGGVAAHAFAPQTQPLSASVGVALICACHRYGWPVAKRRLAAPIVDALAAVIAEHGGRIETGRPVRSLAELPAAEATFLDLAPAAVAEIAAERLPARVARAYRRYRHGPGAFKLDLAVAGRRPLER